MSHKSVLGLVLTLALAGCVTDEEEAVALQQQALQSYEVYLGSLHGHSKASDGDNPPRDVFNWAKSGGAFDFYVLSDHAEFLTDSEWRTNATLADEFNQDGVFTAVRAFEYSNPFGGHANVFETSGLKRWLLTSRSSFYKWVDENNGIGQFNHPGDYGTFDNYVYSANVADNFKFMETANGGDKNSGGKFIGYYNSALAKGWKIAPTANLDNHSLSNSGIRTGVLALSHTRAGLIEALRARRVFSSDDRYIEVRFTFGDHWQGEEVNVPTGTHTFSLNVISDETIAKFELIVNGTSVVSTIPNTSEASWSPSINVTADTYVYARITEADGDVSLSAPIWLNVP